VYRLQAREDQRDEHDDDRDRAQDGPAGTL
jgi:hypothetical protein